MARPSVKTSRTCEICSTKFWRPPSRDNKFCSRKCYFKSDIAKSLQANLIVFEKGYSPFNKGRIMGSGWGEARNKGKKATAEQLRGLAIGWEKNKLGGEHNSGWRGGLTEKNWGLHRSHQYRQWRDAILKRDGKCVECNSTERLEADHIKPVSLYPELLLDLNNGRALCHTCHMVTDTYAGKANKLKKERVAISRFQGQE